MEKALCLSGGGTKGITMLGLLYEMELQGELDDVTVFSGCSVGALIATMCIAGFSCIQQMAYFPEIKDIKVDMTSVELLFKKTGIKRIQKYTKKFRHAVEEKTGLKNPTLLEFYEKTQKTLYISSVNTTKSKVIYFNHIDYPEIKLFDALHASAAIPGLFIPVAIKGSRFIDGGYYNPLPLYPLKDCDTMAIVFRNLDSENMIDEVIRLAKLHCVLAKKEAIKSHKKLTVFHCESNWGTLDFDKSKEEILKEFTYGREQHPLKI